MIKETKAWEIIKGFRGEGINKEKMIDLLVRFPSWQKRKE